MGFAGVHKQYAIDKEVWCKLQESRLSNGHVILVLWFARLYCPL